MASKSSLQQQEPEKAEVIEELLDVLDKSLDRVKVLYEQYFLGIQKQPPQYLHTDIERKIRDLAQHQIRNTALRYRFATLQQKFGSYNSYWRRTTRQIEQGTYVRSLSKIGRQSAKTGEAIPEEILAAMPKRMREQVRRDRELALAVAERRHQTGAEDELLTLEPLPPGDSEDDIAAFIKEPSELRRKVAQHGPHVIDESMDLDAFFAEVAAESDRELAAAEAPPPPPVPAAKAPLRAASLGSGPRASSPTIPRPTADASAAPQRRTGPVPELPGAQQRRTGPVPAVPPPPATPQGERRTGAVPPMPPPDRRTGPVPAIQQAERKTGSVAAMPPPQAERKTGSVAAMPPPQGERKTGSVAAMPPPQAERKTGSVAAMPPPQAERKSGSVAAMPPPQGERRTDAVPPLDRKTGSVAAQVPLEDRKTNAIPVIARPQADRRTDAIPPIPRPPNETTQVGPPPAPPAQQVRRTGASPIIPAPPVDNRRRTSPIPPIPAPSQVTRPVPIVAGASTARPAVPVETMEGPFARVPARRADTDVEPPKPAPRPTPQPLKPPPGMSDADVNALYAKYVKAKEMVGENPGPGAYGKLLKTINSQAPKIMQEYNAKGVDFSVVVKDNQVIIRAKPKP